MIISPYFGIMIKRNMDKCQNNYLNLAGKTRHELEVCKDMIDKIKQIFQNFLAKYNEQDGRRALILFYFQHVLIVILISLIALLLALHYDNEVFYLSMIISLLVIIIVALRFNLAGKYKIASIITMISATIGPWLSIIFDESVRAGDVIPMIYIVLIVHLSSIFFSLRTTILLAIVQFIGVTVLCFTSPELLAQNLPSLFSFFIIASVLVVLGSYINKKQIEQIEDQNLKYLEKDIEMRDLLIHDPMTNLYNRTHLNDIMQNENALKNYSVFMFDIDGLKKINDKFGHLEGDNLIINAANVIKRCFRESDMVGRIGGDEFIAVVYGADLKLTQEIRDKIHYEVEAYNKNCSHKHLILNLSCGYAISSIEKVKFENLMRIADDRMYEMKNSKK